MSLKFLIFAALCLLAAANHEDNTDEEAPTLPEEDPTVSYLTVCIRKCTESTEPTESTTDVEPTTDYYTTPARGVCTPECGVSRRMQRTIALLIKLINVLGEQTKTQSLNVFVDVQLERFNESRYGELTENVAVILGNRQGSFAEAMGYIVNTSYGFINDSETIDVDDAFEVIFGVNYDVTTIRPSASQVLLLAVYAVYRTQNTRVEYAELGNFRGNYSDSLEVLVRLATATVLEDDELRASLSSEQVERAFSGLTGGYFEIEINGEDITVTQNEFPEDEKNTTVEDHTGYEEEETTVGYGETTTHSTRSRSQSKQSKSHQKNNRSHQKSKQQKSKARSGKSKSRASKAHNQKSRSERKN